MDDRYYRMQGYVYLGKRKVQFGEAAPVSLDFYQCANTAPDLKLIVSEKKEMQPDK